jgi:hypothetical protein
VPKDWIENGSVIELELPRHLTCRACAGGGCDACERSGAVTLRGRGEPPDLVEVTLPARRYDESFVIRIPERGGLASVESGLPRGQLFLRIEPAVEGSEPSGSVAMIKPIVVTSRRPLDAAPPELPDRRWVFPLAVAVALALGSAFWLYLRSR